MTKLFFKAGLAGAALLAVQEAGAVSLDFNSISGATPASRGSIRFDGTTDSFTFVNVAAAGPTFGYSFTLSGSDGAGDSFGDLGKVDGTFKIGPITTVGTKQTAPVTLLSGPGILTINDGAGFLLAGKIDWVEIFTDGTAGGLNAGGSINLKSVTYSGGESDLLALVGNATASVQFGFVPSKSLTALVADTVVVKGKTVPNINITTFTGDLASVPDSGATALLLGSGVFGLLCSRRARVRNA